MVPLMTDPRFLNSYSAQVPSRVRDDSCGFSCAHPSYFWTFFQPIALTTDLRTNPRPLFHQPSVINGTNPILSHHQKIVFSDPAPPADPFEGDMGYVLVGQEPGTGVIHDHLTDDEDRFRGALHGQSIASPNDRAA